MTTTPVPSFIVRPGHRRVPAQLSISRPQGGGEERITIEVLDALSRATIVHVAIDLAAFAAALTGVGHMDCGAEVNDRALAQIGLTRESDTVVLPYTVETLATARRLSTPWPELVAFSFSQEQPEMHAAGWRTWAEGDSPNMHQLRTHNAGYTVRVQRWTHPETGAPIQPIPARWETIGVE